jgi:hypothetical protein
MRTAIILFAGMLLGCGSRVVGGADGGHGGDGPVTTDGGLDAAVHDGAPAEGGSASDATVHDGSGLTQCELAGGVCVAVYPGSCPNGTVLNLSCGDGVGVECCLPGDGGVRTCLPSGGCTTGPRCGTWCCNSGEACDTSTTTCKCGAGAACTGGNQCMGGPVSTDGCGTVCCGASGPCPL